MLCHRTEVLQYRLCILQCDWWLENSPQKTINVFNEVRGIGRTYLHQILSSFVGFGHETATNGEGYEQHSYFLSGCMQYYHVFLSGNMQ